MAIVCRKFREKLKYQFETEPKTAVSTKEKCVNAARYGRKLPARQEKLFAKVPLVPVEAFPENLQTVHQKILRRASFTLRRRLPRAVLQTGRNRAMASRQPRQAHKRGKARLGQGFTKPRNPNLYNGCFAPGIGG